MQLVENNAISRGLIRVEPGEDLLSALQQLAQIAGWREGVISGAGSFEMLEIKTVSELVTLENAELLALSGHITRSDGEATVVLRAIVLGGTGLVSGQIQAAVTGKLLLQVDAVTSDARARGMGLSAALNAAASAPSTASSTEAPERGYVEPAKVAVATGSARKVARKSRPGAFGGGSALTKKALVRPSTRRNAGGEDDDTTPDVEPGDFLSHPQLGMCEVVGWDDSGGTKVRMPSGRLRALSLEALRVLPAEVNEDGKRVLKITGPRRRR